MHPPLLVVFALVVFGFGLVARRVERMPLTAPMVFVLLGVVVGPLGVGLARIDLEAEWVLYLAEITLGLILFTDASRIHLDHLREEGVLPLRLLSFGIPLAVLFGTGLAAVLLPTLGLWEMAILATILAPTDAALGEAVLTHPRVPSRIRQAINVEAGLNDGLALPLLFVFLALASPGGPEQTGTEWATALAIQLGGGALVGVAVGWGAGTALSQAAARESTTPAFEKLAILAACLIAFGAAEMIEANGFIATFVGGLALGNTFRDGCSSLWDFAKTEGQALALVVFTVVGAVLTPRLVEGWSWSWLAYAAGSLLLVRMLAAGLSLVGSGLGRSSILFLAWFGPRGIATVIFLMLVLHEAALPGEREIVGVVTATVLLSVVLHGVTAAAFADRYADRVERMQEESLEHHGVREMPV